MDLVFRGADIIDGTGRPRYRADLGVVAGRIAAVGDIPTGSRVVDATGLVLAPGFIDMHAHSDLALLTDAEHLAKLTQGCTTEVIGQDGLSYAPIDEVTAPQLWEQLAAWNGKPDVDLDWRTVGEYLDRLDAGIACNAAYLVPHGTVRMAAMGWNDRPATDAELDHMRRLLDEGLRDGAFGLSAGLSYVPGMYAPTAELVALCDVVARYDGFFAPHQRSYGAGALDGYAEMIEIGRRAGCGVHLTHATMNFGVNAGRAGELLALVDAQTDLDLTLDTYPYLPGATALSALLPSWSMAGGMAACARRLRDPETRTKIQHELDVVGTDGCHGVPVEWDRIEISGVARPEHRSLVGLTVAEAAGTEPAATLVSGAVSPSRFYLELLLAEDFGTGCLMHVGHEDNVRAIMRHRSHMGGSDGLLVGERPHPRAWGTFPRYLGHYSRDEGLLSLEECVAHLSGRPARRLGLRDRGLIRPGHAADLVAFDPDTVADAATFARPRRRAEGIPYVVVNGQLAVDDGRRTGALAGRALRSDGKRRLSR